MHRPSLARGHLALALLAVVSLGSPACDGMPGGGGHGKGEGKRGGGRGHGGPGAEGDDEAMQVEVVRLRPGPIERWYRSSGTLEAIRSAELVAVQPAIIEKVLVDEGDQVDADQLLARLDGRALSLQASAATVELQNLEAELRRLESVRSDAISQEEIDKQRYLVEQARANLKLSKHQAKQTVIRAPFSGTIVTRYVDEGNLASTATPLFHLADLTALELPLHVPEKDAATVSVGTEVEIELVDGTTFTAKIERRAPVVDPLTGTVKLTMRTGPEKPAGAVPGAFARAKVLLDARPDAPGLPRQAVFQVEGKPHVFVVVEASGSEKPGPTKRWKAERREVQLGLEGTDRVEILAGLRPEELVVAEGNAGITEGMPLTPVDPKGESESDAPAQAEIAAAEATETKGQAKDRTKADAAGS
ncbi:efflux RND transporter periplasmic adaptor subunit [Paraliomyxa miuraensis]|uniref:efflux RND transporter periplasmic adaptor subunit n=1 Tax=Paraliomyxa miuraensis TaxID=376150 RepID=UPI00224C7D62|nr:efflux RND transporter periplasmic adaptor subunit [Paraliomyxa miuraensis]MCX4246999.1 efflux RND transporter periplasmic adaptor subunit [Paraliomyxa miuraensis]